MEFFYESIEANPSIPIPLGGELMAEISDMKLRLKFSLVGMEKGNFLLAKACPNDLIGTFRSEAIRERNIKLSFLHGNTVYGFSTEVLNVVTEPSKMFFMAYPKRIEEVSVRNSERYGCTLEAMTMIGHEIAALNILDISREGCLAVINTHKGSPLFEHVQLDKMIDLRVQFPGSGTKGSILGTIRSVNKDIDRVIMGIGFKDLKDEVRVEIDRFISSLSKGKKH